ncbi:unnamed protein product [Rangifer tarandus platyrhynchus]|uniref:Uncharacterized protein n=1 Tax=Rangifer tarandus platyrhynchus TaxID=3082113 RepID=A0AC59YFT6_RANTA
MGTEIMWAPAHGQGVAGGVSTGGAPELAKSLCLDCIKVQGLMSDQNVPFGIRLLSRLGFLLGTQRDTSAGFDEAPLISPPEPLRTRFPVVGLFSFDWRPPKVKPEPHRIEETKRLDGDRDRCGAHGVCSVCCETPKQQHPGQQPLP